MLPAQRNKVDISKLTPAEQQAFRMYGKLPKRPLQKKEERKYFDSGDWAMNKAGKNDGHSTLGREIPTPDAIPHASPTPIGAGGSASSGGSGAGGSFGSGSPPGAGALSPGGLSPGSAAPLGIPNGGVEAPQPQAGIALSMSPGRVGVSGAPLLATSPTRSFHLASAGAPTSPTHQLGGNPLVSRLEREAALAGPASSSPVNPGARNPTMVAGTTGNQFGKTQAHSISPSGTSTSPSTSGLANSVSAALEREEATEDQQIADMEMQ